MSREAIATCALAAAGARLAYAVLRRRPPGGRQLWTRANHRGDPVTLAEGPSLAVAAVAAALLPSAGRAVRRRRAPGPGRAGAPWPVTAGPQLDARQNAALALAGAGAAVVGCYDDLAGASDRRGFRGHLGALAGGELTSGAVKIAGIGLTGLAASALLGAAPAARAGAAGDMMINAALIAGSANLINLFDLRPGRAIKVALAAGLPLAAAGPAARAAMAPLAAALALLPEDLGERAMLGDGGANALGAMLGAAAAATLRRPARLAALAGIVSLTAASEVISFTKIIDNVPVLRWLDLLGRRPVTPPRPGPDRAARPGPKAAAAAGQQ